MKLKFHNLEKLLSCTSVKERNEHFVSVYGIITLLLLRTPKKGGITMPLIYANGLPFIRKYIYVYIYMRIHKITFIHRTSRRKRILRDTHETETK